MHALYWYVLIIQKLRSLGRKSNLSRHNAFNSNFWSVSISFLSKQIFFIACKNFKNKHLNTIFKENIPNFIPFLINTVRKLCMQQIFNFKCKSFFTLFISSVTLNAFFMKYLNKAKKLHMDMKNIFNYQKKQFFFYFLIEHFYCNFKIKKQQFFLESTDCDIFSFSIVIETRKLQKTNMLALKLRILLFITNFIQSAAKLHLL